VKRQKQKDGKAVKWQGISSTTSQKPLQKEPMPMPTSARQGVLDMATRLAEEMHSALAYWSGIAENNI